MKANFEIIIRKETSQKLKLNQNPSLRRFLKQAIEQLCNYKFSTATVILFTLLYEEYEDKLEKALNEFHFTLDTETSFNPDVEYCFITYDDVALISREMQFQYIKAYPAFLNVDNYSDCEKELQALKNKLEADNPILLYGAVRAIHNIEKDESFECVKLLLSDKADCQLKGLQMLKHNHKYQQLLLPYAHEIGQLLKAHMEIENTLVKSAQEELDKSSSPFAVLASLHKRLSEQEAEATHTHISTDEVYQKQVVKSEAIGSMYVEGYPLSPELANFINNKTALTSIVSKANELWKFMKKLRRLGFDLNLLVDKMDYLLAVLAAHDNLENDTKAWQLAKKKHLEAKELYWKNESRDTFQTFVNTGSVVFELNDQRMSAFAAFVEACEAFEHAE